MKYIAIALAAFLSILAFATPVAASGCTDSYGNSTNCTPKDLNLDKTVLNPITNTYVDNLSATQTTFAVGDEIHFKIVIKNNSGETFAPVRARDVLPEFLDFVSGPGTYTAIGRHLDFQIDTLPAGTSQTFEVVAKVNALASDKPLFCTTNYAVASSDARPNGDDDTAQICIGKYTIGATNLPVAGFNDYLLLVPFMGLGLGGFALLRKK